MNDLRERLSAIADYGARGVDIEMPAERAVPRGHAVRNALAGAAMIAVVVGGVVGVTGGRDHPQVNTGPPQASLRGDKKFDVPSQGMAPTINVGDVVLAATKFTRIERGYVVVVDASAASNGYGVKPAAGDLLKRVVALPGETVESRDGRVYVNGRVLDESYLPAGTETSNFAPIKVPADSYWVLGDNRPSSADSRLWGAIPASKIRAVVIGVESPHPHPLLP